MPITRLDRIEWSAVMKLANDGVSDCAIAVTERPIASSDAAMIDFTFMSFSVGWRWPPAGGPPRAPDAMPARQSRGLPDRYEAERDKWVMPASSAPAARNVRAVNCRDRWRSRKAIPAAGCGNAPPGR